MWMMWEHLCAGWQLVNGWRAAHEKWIADLRAGDIAPFVEGTVPLTVLDLGNGRLRPQYAILRAKGFAVYGIDVVNGREGTWKAFISRISRRLYGSQIEGSKGCRDRTLVCGEVAALPFRDEAFGLVTSVAAFEHFLDVPKALEEIRRVLRGGGLVWAWIHLFSSPSGGHNVRLTQVPLRAIPRGIDAWDHLRKRRLPFHVPLNEWRKEQYLSEFAKHFEILKDYCALREGEALLTPEIERELSAYSRDELTSGAYVIVGRKPV